jgi:hypothetical protein
MNERSSDRGHPERWPRGQWWILLLVMVVAAGIFLTLGRTQRDTTAAPPNVDPSAPNVAPPDQIDNTVRADGWDRRGDLEIEYHEPPSVQQASPAARTGMEPAGPDTREGTLD